MSSSICETRFSVGFYFLFIVIGSDVARSQCCHVNPRAEVLLHTISLFGHFLISLS